MAEENVSAEDTGGRKSSLRLEARKGVVIFSLLKTKRPNLVNCMVEHWIVGRI